MVRGREWTGFEAVALQEAMRRSIREFAALLGIETTTVANWRTGLGAVIPRPRMQEILDITLQQRATAEDRARFDQLVAEGEAAWRARHRHTSRRTVMTTEIVPVSDSVALLDGSAVESAPGDHVNKVDQADLTGAARASLEFAQWANDTAVDQLTIESLYFELARIATTYVHQPLRPLLVDLVAQRDRAWQLLKMNLQPPQARDLLFLGGVAITMLAEATGDLGDPFAAIQHTLAAERLARQADHPSLKAWIAGTPALITEWSGRPGRATRFVRQAAADSPPSDQRLRLAALEARAAARAGRADDARDALRPARLAVDQSPIGDDLQDFGGILSFPKPKAMYYAGSTLTLIGDHAEAERSAMEAIAAYEAGPAKNGATATRR